MIDLKGEDIKLSYVLLDGNAVNNGLGGLSHIRGVIEACQKNFIVSLVGSDVNNVKHEGLNFKAIDVASSFTSLRVFFWFLKDAESDVYLFRKSFFSMYIVSFLIAVKKFFFPKRRYFIEFNGISGDFKVKSKIFSRILKVLNAIPLVLYDGVYCVNDNIAERLVSTRVVNKNKVFVCRNGGSEFVKKCHRKNFIGSKIDLVYYGANLPHYHIELLSDEISYFNSKFHDGEVCLHLVGPGMEGLARDKSHVFSYGRKSLSDLKVVVEKLPGRVWGVVPLERLGFGDDVEPIKVFDYLSLGFPVFHSSSCLKGYEYDGMSISYDLCKEKSIYGSLRRLSSMTDGEYSEYVDKARDLYATLTWSSRLSELVKRMKSL